MFFLHIFTFKFEMIKHIRLISKEYERWNGGDGNADDKIETDTPPFLRHTRLRVFVEIRCDDRPPQWESLRVGKGWIVAIGWGAFSDLIHWHETQCPEVF